MRSPPAGIAAVIGAGGKDHGDAAGLVELPGGGRILYIAALLLRDPIEGPRFLEGAFRFLAVQAKTDEPKDAPIGDRREKGGR